MRSLKCVIIDDESLAIKIIVRYLESVQWLECLASFTKPLEALKFLQENPVDLIFLDINMPELDGIGLVGLLQQQPMIIFTSAYPEYAVESYELSALDYLLKPFSLTRFLKAVQKAQTVHQNQNSSNQEEVDHLVVRADRKIYRIPYNQIIFLQAYGDYVKIRTEKEWIVPKVTLVELEQQLLGGPFLRTHRAYLINQLKVDYIEGNQIALQNEKVPISKSYKDMVLSKFGI